MKVKRSSSFSRDDDRYDRLVRGARQRFFAQGFRNVTMDDLAVELGMSKRTFYALFRSKRLLLETVLERKLADIEHDLQQINQSSSKTIRSRLTELIATLQRHAQEFHPAILRDLQRETPDLYELLNQRRSALIQEHFGQALGEAQKARLIRSDISIPLLIQMLLGAIQRLLEPELLMKFQLDPHDVFTLAAEFFLDGAAVRQGRLS